MYYLVLYIILFSLAILDYYADNYRLRKILYILIYILFVFTAGLKYETGVDWRAYEELVSETAPLQKIGSSEWYETVVGQLDIGFFLLISTIKSLGGGLQTLFFIISAISSLFLLLAFYKINPRYGLFGAVLYYCMVFFYLDMSGIRQAFALCASFFSLYQLLNRKYWSFALIGTLAVLFHWSSLFFLIAGYLSKSQFNKITIALIITIGLLFYSLNINLVSFFLPIIGPLLLSGNFSERVILYTSSEIFAGDRGITARSIIHFLLLFAYLFTYFIALKKDQLKEYKYIILFKNILLVQLFSSMLLFSLPEISERLKLYFYTANMVLVPSLLIFIKPKFLKAGYVLFIGLFGFFYGNIFLLEKSIAVSYVPYQNFLIYKILDKKSTGETRLEEHIYELDAK